MRLTCPNCSAQYDIPEEMIPPEGREVQCSDCATVWMQMRPGPDGKVPPPPDPAAPIPAPARRPLADEATLDILRQERAHEARLRAAERRRTRQLTRMLPAGSDDVLDPPRQAAAAERARMAAAASVARARDVPEEDTAPASDEADRAPVPIVDDDVSAAIARTLREMTESDPAPSSAAEDTPRQGERRQARRDLLPDIEEINSSLRPDERALENADPDEQEHAADGAHMVRADRKSGFSLGFTAIMMLVGLGVAIYLFASPLGEAVPQLDAPLSSYVATIDSGRLALEQRVDAIAAHILKDQ